MDRVLIVDDEEEIGLMVGQFLKDQCRPDYAKSLYQARFQMNALNYQLFILDVHLEDGNGLELIPAIKNQNPDAKIIAISAFDDLEDFAAKEPHIDAFLSKPFTKKEIILEVSSLLN
jgi:DNA-binding response OmpR family regulator